VATIDSLFSHAARGAAGTLDASHSTKLRGLWTLVDAIPAELVQCSDADYSAFVLAVATIEETLAQWQSRGAVGAMPPSGGADAVTTLRRILVQLPDEYPPAAHAELVFITSAELRESIRTDVGAAHRANKQAEWKAATVLAGAAIEALLHWRLSEETSATIAAARRAPKRGLNDYVLNDYIHVAEDLSIIPAQTATAALLAKDYRNLIHPGRAVRLSEKCSRSTSLQALGALEAVIEALSLGDGRGSTAAPTVAVLYPSDRRQRCRRHLSGVRSFAAIPIRAVPRAQALHDALGTLSPLSAAAFSVRPRSLMAVPLATTNNMLSASALNVRPTPITALALRYTASRRNLERHTCFAALRTFSADPLRPPTKSLTPAEMSLKTFIPRTASATITSTIS
jgi:hypothetical protein